MSKATSRGSLFLDCVGDREISYETVLVGKCVRRFFAKPQAAGCPKECDGGQGTARRAIAVLKAGGVRKQSQFSLGRKLRTVLAATSDVFSVYQYDDLQVGHENHQDA